MNMSNLNPTMARALTAGLSGYPTSTVNRGLDRLAHDMNLEHPRMDPPEPKEPQLVAGRKAWLQLVDQHPEKADAITVEFLAECDELKELVTDWVGKGDTAVAVLRVASQARMNWIEFRNRKLDKLIDGGTLRAEVEHDEPMNQHDAGGEA